jgi:hypothetical protein
MRTTAIFAAAAATCLLGGVTMATEPVKECAPVKPYWIPGKNPGGNRTCDEVAYFYKDYFAGSFKSDAGQLYDYLPDWLKVYVKDHKYVDWKSTKYIGAVIVKGGPAANVYYYKDPCQKDNYLHPPKNDSGKPADLSNITFCFKKQYSY